MFIKVTSSGSEWRLAIDVIASYCSGPERINSGGSEIELRNPNVDGERLCLVDQSPEQIDKLIARAMRKGIEAEPAFITVTFSEFDPDHKEGNRRTIPLSDIKEIYDNQSYRVVDRFSRDGLHEFAYRVVETHEELLAMIEAAKQ